MKLLSRYYRVNIAATIIVVLLSSVCYYYMIHFVLLEQLDNALKVEEQEVIDYVKKNHILPNPSTYKDQQVLFQPAGNRSINKKFSTVDVYNNSENEHIATRQLVFPINVVGKTFNVYILKSQEETEDLIQLIVLITLGVVILLLLIIFFINRFLLSRLWKPFNSTLQQLKQFNLSRKSNLKLEPTPIHEFTELNQAVSIMAKQVNREYSALKDFTGNASHEMQTPLAIIHSKLDVLIQDESISEQQMQQLQGIYSALDRLSKLNQSLLLLAKIENNQFNETENVSMDKLIQEKLEQFEELIENKKLHVSTQLESMVLYCNKQLLDILFANLLNNAIRYNKEAGSMSIKLANKELIISNSSLLPALDEHKIFERFYRHAETRQEGNGLGLSIVKQICQDSNYSVNYRFHDKQHEFNIHF